MIRPSNNCSRENKMKNAGIAAVLSFFVCGLGQIYNGQIFKGLFTMACYAAAWALTYVLVGWLIVPVLWVWGMFDAYKTAERINREQ